MFSPIRENYSWVTVTRGWADGGARVQDLLTAFGDDMHDALREVAREGPLARSPETGVVMVLRHADVEALGRDPRLVGAGLSNFDVMGIGEGPLRDWYGSLMFTNEGDVHRRLRLLVQKAFTPRAVAAIRVAAVEMAAETFAPLAADGGGDLVTISNLLPLRVICRLIGVPDGDVAEFAGWADALSVVFGFVTPEQADAATVALAHLDAYVDRLLDARRAAPGDDLVSALLVAEVDGEHLSHDEVRTMVGNLIVGGNDTTGSQIGCSFLTLLRNPEQAGVLAARPDLVPHAVEETMRFEPSISGIPRVPLEPIVVSGESIAAGTLVILSTAAANREAGVWHEPDTVDLTRFEQPG